MRILLIANGFCTVVKMLSFQFFFVAFNTVSSLKFIHRLNSYGTMNAIFLMKRVQLVVVKGILLVSHPMVSIASRSADFGSTLFVSCIKELPDLRVTSAKFCAKNVEF